MHQAYITGLGWSVFVTSKVVNGEGSIVQTIIIEFTEEEKAEYGEKLLPRAHDVIAWLHDPALIGKRVSG